MHYLVEDGSRGAREVLSLLKTCTTFYESALDILWQHLDIMAPLVMCLPGDAWKIKNKVLVRIIIAFGCSALDHLSNFLSAVPNKRVEAKGMVKIYVPRPARQKHRTRASWDGNS